MNQRRHHVLIIDSQPIVREGIVSVISSSIDGIAVTGSDSFPDALGRIQRDQIDLVVSDFRVRGDLVLSFLKGLRAGKFNTRCLIVSDLNEILIGCACAKAGASGFVKKTAPVTTVTDAIRQIIAGGSFFSERLSRALMAHPRDQMPASNGLHLTARELEVFYHIGEGLRVSEIAPKLGVCVKTIEAHRENLKNKLALQNSAQVHHAAVRWFDDSDPSI